MYNPGDTVEVIVSFNVIKDVNINYQLKMAK